MALDWNIANVTHSPDPRNVVGIGADLGVYRDVIVTAVADDPTFPAVVLDLTFRDGRYAVERMAAIDESGPGVTADHLRQIPVREIVRAGLMIVGFVQESPAPGGGYEFKATTIDQLATIDDVSERTAIVYRIAFAMGEAPTKAVAEHFGITQSTATKRVIAARRSGLIEPTTAGKAKA